MTPPLLSCEGVGFGYGKERVIEGVNLELHQGELCAIIGPNGGGKSTFGKIIVGLLEPQEGRVLHEGKKRMGMEGVGYVPQDTSLNKDFPIRAIDVVLMGFLKPKGFGMHAPSQEEQKRAMELLESLGMRGFARRRIGDLSGGQRQRVLIARALAGDPKLLVLDEPTASIDARGQREIYAFLKELSQERGVIVISHDVSLLKGYASKALYINHEAVMHTLEEIHRALPVADEHLCEVEFLQAFEHREEEKRRSERE